jgi:hypothetical protein
MKEAIMLKKWLYCVPTAEIDQVHLFDMVHRSEKYGMICFWQIPLKTGSVCYIIYIYINCYIISFLFYVNAWM